MKIAVVSARGLGDSLISQVLSYNFSQSGHDVTTFSTPLCQMRRWFPRAHILPFPSEEAFPKLFSSFNLVLSQDHSCVSFLSNTFKNLIVFNDKNLNKKKSLVENFVHICKEYFHLSSFEKSNGIVPPSGLRFKSHNKRVILHPFSTDPKREWPLPHFFSLAKKLSLQGFIPTFVSTFEEQNTYLKNPLLTQKYEWPNCSTLDELACLLYESGFFIGNNSGPGHLSSNLGLPTLSLFARKSYSRLWRPAFYPSHVITPFSFAIGARAKERSFKTHLSVSKVLRAFTCLTKKELP